MDFDDLPDGAGPDTGGNEPRRKSYEEPERRSLLRALLFSVLEHPVLWSVGSGAAVIGLGIAAYLAHGWIDDSYHEKYEDTLKIVADKSAATCGLDGNERKQELFATVYDDVENSSGTSLMNKIPFIGGWMPSFEWFPNKRVFNTVSAIEENGISLYPSTFSDRFSGVSAVIYTDGSAPVPVLAYNGVNDNELGLLMDAVGEQGGLKQGALALFWNDATDEFETVQFGIGQKQARITGFTDVTLPENPCYEPRSLTAKATGAAGEAIDDAAEAARAKLNRAKERVKGWMPDFGGDGEEVQEQPVDPQPAPEQAPEETTKAPAEPPAPVAEPPATEGQGEGSWMPEMPKFEKPKWVPW